MEQPTKDNKDQVVEAEKPNRWYDLSLKQALSLAIFASLLVVALAIKLYASNANHRYDISRPGSHYNPPKLSIGESTDVDTSSPVSQQTLKQTNKIINDQLKKLSPYGNYGDKSLSANNLGLAPRPKSSPADNVQQ